MTQRTLWIGGGLLLVAVIIVTLILVQLKMISGTGLSGELTSEDAGSGDSSVQCSDDPDTPGFQCPADGRCGPNDECKEKNNGTGCGCVSKGKSCIYCISQEQGCDTVWVDDTTDCGDPEFTSVGACNTACKKASCGDTNPGTTELECGGDGCPEGTLCGLATNGTETPSDDACMCLPPDLPTDDDDDVTIYSCGKSGNSCSGDCPPPDEGLSVHCDKVDSPGPGAWGCECVYTRISSDSSS